MSSTPHALTGVIPYVLYTDGSPVKKKHVYVDLPSDEKVEFFHLMTDGTGKLCVVPDPKPKDSAPDARGGDSIWILENENETRSFFIHRRSAPLAPEAVAQLRQDTRVETKLERDEVEGRVKHFLRVERLPLEKLLKKTMLLVAAPKLKLQEWPGEFKVEAAEEPPSGADDTSGRYWQYALAVEDGGPRLSDLKCCVPSCCGTASWTRQDVCESITWGPVSVIWRGIERDLPLAREYLLGHHGIATDGARQAYIGNASKSEIFSWPVDVDSGVQLVFGYEWDAAHSAFVPFSAETREQDDFPEFEEPDPQAPPRVIVCASFICCRPKADFEAFKVLVAARVYPLIQVFASVELDKVCGAVKLLRPGESSMSMDNMEEAMGTAVYTDRNLDSEMRQLEQEKEQMERLFGPLMSLAPGLPPMLPSWNFLFDYYSILPEDPVHTFRAVYATKDGKGSDLSGPGCKEVTIPGSRRAFKDFEYWRDLVAWMGSLGLLFDVGKRVFEWGLRTAVDKDLVPMPDPRKYFTSTAVTKLAGQGEFDNIHLAPKMILEDRGEKIPVAMAPICQHDCFHTHWRWGKIFDVRQNKGWSWSAEGGKPHERAGAPLVPLNQDVWVTTHEARGFTYRAECVGPIPPGKMQVIMHHGSGYAVEVEKEVREIVELCVNALDAIETGISALRGTLERPRLFRGDNTPENLWPRLYYFFRYAAIGVERIAPLSAGTKGKLVQTLEFRLVQESRDDPRNRRVVHGRDETYYLYKWQMEPHDAATGAFVGNRRWVSFARTADGRIRRWAEGESAFDQVGGDARRRGDRAELRPAARALLGAVGVRPGSPSSAPGAAGGRARATRIQSRPPTGLGGPAEGPGRVLHPLRGPRLLRHRRKGGPRPRRVVGARGLVPLRARRCAGRVRLRDGRGRPGLQPPRPDGPPRRRAGAEDPGPREGGPRAALYGDGEAPGRRGQGHAPAPARPEAGPEARRELWRSGQAAPRRVRRHARGNGLAERRTARGEAGIPGAPRVRRQGRGQVERIRRRGDAGRA